MPKKSGKAAKNKNKTAPPRRSAKPPKVKSEAEIVALAAPAHVQRFVDDLLTRGEAGFLKNGKLPLGKTHIIENKKGAGQKLTRARYNLVG